MPRRVIFTLLRVIDSKTKSAVTERPRIVTETCVAARRKYGPAGMTSGVATPSTMNVSLTAWLVLLIPILSLFVEKSRRARR